MASADWVRTPIRLFVCVLECVLSIVKSRYSIACAPRRIDRAHCSVFVWSRAWFVVLLWRLSVQQHAADHIKSTQAWRLHPMRQTTSLVSNTSHVIFLCIPNAWRILAHIPCMLTVERNRLMSLVYMDRMQCHNYKKWNSRAWFLQEHISIVTRTIAWCASHAFMIIYVHFVETWNCDKERFLLCCNMQEFTIAELTLVLSWAPNWNNSIDLIALTWMANVQMWFKV